MTGLWVSGDGWSDDAAAAGSDLCHDPGSSGEGLGMRRLARYVVTENPEEPVVTMQLYMLIGYYPGSSGGWLYAPRRFYPETPDEGAESVSDQFTVLIRGS